MRILEPEERHACLVGLGGGPRTAGRRTIADDSCHAGPVYPGLAFYREPGAAVRSVLTDLS